MTRKNPALIFSMEWHAADNQEILDRLAVDATRGLSSEEARERLASHGPNELQVKEGPSPWKIFLRQFRDPLIIILLLATGLSALVGEVFNAALILIIVIFSAGLGFLQEYRAERAVEALRKMLSPSVKVLRGRNETEISARDIVPGDIVLLNTGDRVPADSRVLESHVLKADEAALTGESVPVAKSPDTLPADTPVAERRNMLFMGTAVVHGRSRAVVVATAMEAEFGRIARAVSGAKETKTPLERRTAEIGKRLGILSIAVIILVMAVGLARRLLQDEGLSLEFGLTLALFGVSLAVAAVPEALAGIVTGTLGVGMRRMARRNALVREMPAVEALGSVTVICADKTGTITRGEMTVRKIYAGGRTVEVTGVGYEPKGEFRPADASGKLSLLLRAALLCNDATLAKKDEAWSIQGDPTEGALLVMAVKAGLDLEKEQTTQKRIDEVAFSSERKRMTTVHETREGKTAFMKGAAEVVMERCSSELRNGDAAALGEKRRKELRNIADDMAAAGLRVLALAFREVDAKADDLESGMTLLGFVGMIDPPRDESIDAARTCRDIGVHPVMITGDHKLTAIAVAREVNIYRDGDNALTGDELEDLSDDDFDNIVERVSVYARVSPNHKLKIIGAWKRRGQLVAMTGDGVNDAPALKHADVGVAMGVTGTEVAKEAADIVLADDNFATIIAAIEMGRWIYDNIQKYLTYLLRANIIEVTVIGGVVLYMGVDYLPMLPAAILYINLVTDGLPAIALGFSPPEPDLMQRPPRDPKESVFSVEMKAFVLLSLVITPVFFWIFFRAENTAVGRTELFFLFLLVELAMAFNLRSLRYSLLQAPPHGWLVAAVVGSIAVTAAVLTWPQAREAFGIGIPTLETVEIALAVTIAVTVLSELVKVVLRKRKELSHK